MGTGVTPELWSAKNSGKYCNHMSQESVSWKCDIGAKSQWTHHHQYVLDKGILRKGMLEKQNHWDESILRVFREEIESPVTGQLNKIADSM